MSTLLLFLSTAEVQERGGSRTWSSFSAKTWKMKKEHDGRKVAHRKALKQESAAATQSGPRFTRKIRAGYVATDYPVHTDHIEAIDAAVFQPREIPSPRPGSRRLETDSRSRLSAATVQFVALGIARLVVQVEMLVGESGDRRGFNAAEWVVDWLGQPMPALGGCPAEFMGTAEGQAKVANLLARAQSGAYA